MATNAESMLDIGNIKPGSAEFLSTFLQGRGLGCGHFPTYTTKDTNHANVQFPSRLGFLQCTGSNTLISILETEKLCLNCLQKVVPNGYNFWSNLADKQGGGHGLTSLQAPPSLEEYPPFIQAGTETFPEPVIVPIPDVPRAKDAWAWLLQEQKPFFIDHLHLIKKLTPSVKRAAERDSNIISTHGMSYHQRAVSKSAESDRSGQSDHASNVGSATRRRAVGREPSSSRGPVPSLQTPSDFNRGSLHDTIMQPLAAGVSRSSSNISGQDAQNSTGSLSRAGKTASPRTKGSRASSKKSIRLDTAPSEGTGSKLETKAEPVRKPASDIGLPSTTDKMPLFGKSTTNDKKSVADGKKSKGSTRQDKDTVVAHEGQTATINGLDIIKQGRPIINVPIQNSVSLEQPKGNKSTLSNVDNKPPSTVEFKSLTLSAEILSKKSKSARHTETSLRTKNWSRHTLAQFETHTASPDLTRENIEYHSTSVKKHKTAQVKPKKSKKKEMAEKPKDGEKEHSESKSYLEPKAEKSSIAKSRSVGASTSADMSRVAPHEKPQQQIKSIKGVSGASESRSMPYGHKPHREPHSLNNTHSHDRRNASGFKFGQGWGSSSSHSKVKHNHNGHSGKAHGHSIGHRTQGLHAGKSHANGHNEHKPEAQPQSLTHIHFHPVTPPASSHTGDSTFFSEAIINVANTIGTNSPSSASSSHSSDEDDSENSDGRPTSEHDTQFWESSSDDAGNLDSNPSSDKGSGSEHETVGSDNEDASSDDDGASSVSGISNVVSHHTDTESDQDDVESSSDDDEDRHSVSSEPDHQTSDQSHEDHSSDNDQTSENDTQSDSSDHDHESSDCSLPESDDRGDEPSDNDESDKQSFDDSYNSDRSY
ncbi:hypothetical protein ACHAQD_009250 [Fusarium lateritium]